MSGSYEHVTDRRERRTHTHALLHIDTHTHIFKVESKELEEPSFRNRWVHLDTVSRQIFGDIQETQFSGSKMEVHVLLKNAFLGGIGNRWITFGYNLWFSSHPSSRSFLLQKFCESKGNQFWHILSYNLLGIFLQSDTETEFPGIWTYLRRDVVNFCIWAFLLSLRQRILRGRGSKPDIWPSSAQRKTVW